MGMLERSDENHVVIKAINDPFIDLEYMYNPNRFECNPDFG